MTKPRVLVTGVSGFIAKHCAIELLAAGYGVRGTVRSPGKSEAVRGTLARHVDVGRLEFATADLDSDAGWDEAVDGCRHVLHVASPFPPSVPRDEQELIRPAVQGTLRVLEAAVRGGLERFVQTSSMAAVLYGHPAGRKEPYTEADWTQVDAPGVAAYVKSKTLAERTARDYVARAPGGLHYASVNPGLVLGPALDRDIGTSAEIVRSFLRGKYPGSPRVSIPCVDVRDVAKMHRLALEADVPAGGRYLGAAETLWMTDIAAALRQALGPAARKVPKGELPDWLMRIVALVDGTARQAVPDLGKWLPVDTARTRQTLGIEFIPARDAAVATARSLLDLGLA
ncbi:MAG: aldehyde reductase [Lysobacterales bacterium]|jgi:nucleoside-diphosphate-sugar epimerase|nr:MAG: aldehyde reductase [Xanthomonadales bacterium]